MPTFTVCRGKWRKARLAQRCGSVQCLFNEHWSLTTLREKLIKIGARIVRHGRYVVFQLAEVAVPHALFAAILRRIERLRGPPVAVA